MATKDFPGIDVGDATVPVRFLGGVVIPPNNGTAYFVDSATGSQYNDGLSWQTAKATLKQAVIAADDYDTIYVAPGHSETISSAVTVSQDGLTIIGVGNADMRPSLTIGGTSISGIAVTGANVKIQNIQFPNASGTTVTAAINVGAAGLTISRCKFVLGGGFTDAIVVPAAGTNLVVEHCEVRLTANGPRSWIRTTADNTDGPKVRSCWVDCTDGSHTFSQGIFDFVSKTVAMVQIANNLFIGYGTAVTTVANGGSLTNPTIGPNVYKGTVVSSDNVMPQPTSGLGYVVTKQESCANATTGADLFTVTGKVLITSWALEITTGAPGTNCTDYLLRVKTDGTALSAATDIHGASVGTLMMLNGDAGDTLAGNGLGTKAADTNGKGAANRVVGLIGGSCTLQSAHTNPGSGSAKIEHILHYLPLTPGASVAAA